MGMGRGSYRGWDRGRGGVGLWVGAGVWCGWGQQTGMMTCNGSVQNAGMLPIG